jgi:aspartyl-tRNA(Asn)/glutamyl-tRNA(Gln) amidotransferase subunit B
MRSKETEADYRYFHEPDLLPVQIDETWQAAILRNLPELPLERRRRFTSQYGLPEYDADILTGERRLSEYYEATVSAYGGNPKRVSNWLMNDVLRMLNERGLSAGDLRLTPVFLAEIIKQVDSGSINTSTGKSLLEKVESSGKTPAEIVQAEGLAKVSDEQAIRSLCADVLAESPEQVASYKAGKETLMGWFVGNVMKKSRGKADAQLAKNIIEEMLGSNVLQ